MDLRRIILQQSNRIFSWLTAIVLVCNAGPLPSQEPPASTFQSGNLNWELPTVGGKQFWTDLRIQDGWRIQQNSETGHFRLLDAGDIRKAWGTYQACDAKLNRQIDSGVVAPYAGKVVILLHGLIRTGDSMLPLADVLRERGFRPINFRYASSRGSVESHAAALRNVINQLGPQVTEINFVGHSLGNIVVRRYVGNARQLALQPIDGRIKRMVMLGPPNQGSKMARLMKNSVGFRLVAGVSGRQLSRDWQRLKPSLGIPPFEFGVLAGGQADAALVDNVLLPGKDDFTVSVDETKLSGATDFLVAPLVHTTMMADPAATAWAVQFLERGYFRTAQLRASIP